MHYGISNRSHRTVPCRVLLVWLVTARRLVSEAGMQGEGWTLRVVRQHLYRRLAAQ